MEESAPRCSQNASLGDTILDELCPRLRVYLHLPQAIFTKIITKCKEGCSSSLACPELCSVCLCGLFSLPRLSPLDTSNPFFSPLHFLPDAFCSLLPELSFSLSLSLLASRGHLYLLQSPCTTSCVYILFPLCPKKQRLFIIHFPFPLGSSCYLLQ